MAGRPRDEVARTTRARAGMLRKASGVTMLAVLGAAALVPVVAAVSGGTVAAVAIAGVAGNVGAGYVTGLVERVADRVRGRGHDSAAVQAELERELTTALEANSAQAGGLAEDLIKVLAAVGGLRAAVEVSHDDLRAHLIDGFGRLAADHAEISRQLAAIQAELGRQRRDRRRGNDRDEEIVDRLRDLTRQQAERPEAEARTPAPPIEAVVVHATPPAPADTWMGGIDVPVGPDTYLLHDVGLAERFSADRSIVWQCALAARTLPARDRGEGFGWLRRVRVRRDSAAGTAALRALDAERTLIERLGRGAGLPRIERYATGDRTATLVTRWPAARSGKPCGCLDELATGGVPLDAWQTGRLLDALAGLCATLARLHGLDRHHRMLTPDALIMLDNGRLVLRDLGLAVYPYEPGEGPDGYRAPEQTRRGGGRAGPRTDVFQVAAIAYALLTGQPPRQPTPLPVRHEAPDVPEPAAEALDAALAADPSARPDIAALAARLRDPRRS